MKTPRTLYKIQENIPGTEIAAETSAAMAASSIVFREIDKGYARNILNKAKWASFISLNSLPPSCILISPSKFHPSIKREYSCLTSLTSTKEHTTASARSTALILDIK